MKKLLAMAAAVAAVLSVTTSAYAFTLSSGQFQMHARDGTNSYTSGTATPLGGDIKLGDEVRTVFNVDSVAYNGGSAQVIPFAELTGVETGLVVIGKTTDFTGAVTLYFGAPATAPGVFSKGGNFSTYNDLTPEQADMVALLDPNGTAVADGPTQWTSPTDFPNVTEAPLFLQGKFMTLFQGKFDALGNPDLVSGTLYDIYLMDTFSALVPGEGHSQVAFLDVDPTIGAGAQLAQGIFDVGLTGQKADMSLQFDLYSKPITQYKTGYAVKAGWNVQSSDPIEGMAIPEPATMTLLGLGIAGLLSRRSRK